MVNRREQTHHPMRSLVGNTRLWAEIIVVLSIFRQITLSQQPTIHHVPKQYQTIQSAIDKAHKNDTIIVKQGTYFENIRITKNITLASKFLLDRDSTHIRNTIIDGSRTKNKRKGSTIIISGPTDTSCAVIGFTIRGGTGTYDIFPGDILTPHWIVGGGIYLQKSGARIAHNIITRNTLNAIDSIECTSGGGIACFDQPRSLTMPPVVIIEDNLVTENTITGRFAETAGIAIQAPGVVRRNTVMYNKSMARTRAPGGGIGLYLSKEYVVTAEQNYVRYNNAGIGGGFLVGALVPPRGRAVIMNNIVADNTATEVGGGVHVAENATAFLLNNTIVENQAGSDRDGVSATASSVAILANNIIWSSAGSDKMFWMNTRSVNNLSNEDIGVNSIQENPMFMQNDTLFRISDESPAVGTGTNHIHIGGKVMVMPQQDYLGQRRRNNGWIDLGAIASSSPPTAKSGEILAEWKKQSSSHLKLTWYHQQVTAPTYTRDNLQLVRAGAMRTLLNINDSLSTELFQSMPETTLYLPPGDNLLEIELIARGRTESSRLPGNFRIEKIDKSGLNVPRSRPYTYRSYSDLPPGSYVLTSYAQDETGFIDSHNKRSVRLIVLPFWYQRWWSYGLMILLGAGVIAYIYSLKIQRLHQERLIQKTFSQQQIENEERQRKKLASELHDGLGQELLIISNELQSFLRNGGKEHEGLQRAAEMVQESIEEVRTISSELHPHHIDRLGFCAAVEAMVDKLFHASTIAMNCRCAPIDGLIPKENKIHFFRIIQESLTNIIRHSSATEARLEITQYDNAILITIEDNGKGFDLHEFESAPIGGASSKEYVRGFGINSMNERARIAGAQLNISTGDGNGTVIRITVQITERIS
ncbi:MAG: ATP-binding protein [Bacteroidota bacterium]